MRLVEITPSTDSRMFHDTARALYADDPNWIAPLDQEVEAVFDPKKNAAFEHGEAVRWVLRSEDGRLLGRIAAFVDQRKARWKVPPAGGVGSFACVDDPDAAARMFGAARDWLAARGLEAMDGSVNFGENFVDWGVLVEGFMPQGYGMPYNKPYYARLFEAYGFREYYRQFSYHIDLGRPFPERMVKFADFLMSRPGFSFRHFEKRDAAKFIRDMTEVINTTWADYMEGYEPVPEEDIGRVLMSAQAVLVEDFIWFAYKDDRPVGVVVAFPDVNQVLARFRGRLNPLQALRFLLLKSGKTITRNRVLMAGVIPEFQNSGVIAPLFLKFVRAVETRPHYREIELSWVGDYNPRMRKVYEQIGAVQKKVHATYRYLFDRSRPFERFTNEGGNSALRREAAPREEEGPST
jgi:hypothetical protein